MNEKAGRRMEAVPLFSVLAAVVLVCLRLVLQMDYIDQKTGFYNTNSIVSTIFNILYFVGMATIFFLAYADNGLYLAPTPPASKGLGVVTVVLGLAVLYQGAMDVLRPHPQGPRGAADLFLVLATLLLSIGAGVVLLLLVADRIRAQKRRYTNTGVLAIIVMHRCFLLMGGFTRHTTSVAVSEDVLETLLLVLGVLFMVAHTRLMTGYGLEKSLRLLVFSGSAYAVTGIAMLAPDLLGAAMGRVALSPARMGALVQTAATILYCAVFTPAAIRCAGVDTPRSRGRL